MPILNSASRFSPSSIDAARLQFLEQRYAENMAQLAAEQATQRGSLLGIGPLGFSPTMAGQRTRDVLSDAGDLYLRQQFPALAQRGGTTIGKNVYAPRHYGGGRRRAPDQYYGDSVYAPRSVGQAAPAMQAVYPSRGTETLRAPVQDWTPPMSVEEVQASQAGAGTAPATAVPTGALPTHSGYMFAGSTDQFSEDEATRDWMLREGLLGEEDLEAYGLPPVER